MNLWTTQKNIMGIYSSFPKIIIAKSEAKDFALFHKDAFYKVPENSGLMEGKGIGIYQYHEGHEGGILLPFGEEKEEGLVMIDQAPTFFSGFLFLSPQAKQELDLLRGWWEDHAPEGQVPPVLPLEKVGTDGSFEAVFLRLMFGQVAKERIFLAERLTQLHREYLQLRTLYEETQDSFSGVESFLNRAKLSPLHMAFENAPAATGVVGPGSTGGSLAIKQLLPLPGSGLGQIDLYVQEDCPSGAGQLMITLHNTDDESCLAQWTVPYENLRKGWFPLELPIIPMSLEKDAELRIEWRGLNQSFPGLSLGAFQPLPYFRVVAQDLSFEQSLAFRLWVGLPGSRKILNLFDPREGGGGYLGQATLARMVPVTKETLPKGLPCISLSKDHSKILTHPHVAGPTIALIPDGFPPGAKDLTATVTTEHSKAGLIEYAMALIHKGTDPISCLEANAPGSPAAFSGWVPVKPLQPCRIKLSFDRCGDRYYDIVIATRIPQGSQPHLGWAYWSDFLVGGPKEPAQCKS